MGHRVEVSEQFGARSWFEQRGARQRPAGGDEEVVFTAPAAMLPARPGGRWRQVAQLPLAVRFVGDGEDWTCGYGDWDEVS